MTTKTIEERVEVLERKTENGVLDTTGMSDEDIALLKARGIIPLGTAAPNPMARGFEIMAEIQAGWTLPPLTPEEALSRYSNREPPSICLFTQKVRLTDNADHRRIDYPRGWFLVPAKFANHQLVSGYCGTETVPSEVLDQLATWRPPND